MAKKDQGQVNDAGYKKTDEQLEQLEARLSSLYADAGKELQRKLSKFMEEYDEKNQEMQDRVEEGSVTEAEYDRWKKNQLAMRKKMNAQIDSLTETLVHTDKVAMQMVNGELPSIYASNYNYEGYKMEKTAQAYGEIVPSFTVYNADAVARLAKEDPELLPAVNPKKVDVIKDTKWNKSKINTAITQGILQGESSKDISKRLMAVTNMDENAALRNARTALVGAQNAGRLNAAERIRKTSGLDIVEVWSSTRDGRTRDTHIFLNGQEKEKDGYFHTINGDKLKYPCDPAGKPAEVYNCRCRLNTLIANIDHSKDDELYAEFMSENYPEDWVAIKTSQQKKEEAYEKNKNKATEKINITGRIDEEETDEEKKKKKKKGVK